MRVRGGWLVGFGGDLCNLSILGSVGVSRSRKGGARVMSNGTGEDDGAETAWTRSWVGLIAVEDRTKDEK